MKIDIDVKKMDVTALRKEVMRLRTAFRQELCHTGNHRCWINLLSALPEGKTIEPLALPEEVFLKFCERYYGRNSKKRVARKKRNELSKLIQWMCVSYPRQVARVLVHSIAGHSVLEEFARYIHK